MRPPTLHPIPVASVGRHKSFAFVDGPGNHYSGMVDVEDYPPSLNGEMLRDLRGANGMGWMLRKTAQAFGIRASELSGLELGRLTLTDVEWEEVWRFFRWAKEVPYEL